MAPEALQFNIQRQTYWIRHYKQENNPAAVRQAEEIKKALEKAITGKGAAC
jgi:hypothetical protein